MKVTYELDMDKDKLSLLKSYENAQAIMMAIDDIKQQVREWYKYDMRGEIPKNEVISSIRAIIEDAIDIDKLYKKGDNNEG